MRSAYSVVFLENVDMVGNVLIHNNGIVIVGENVNLPNDLSITGTGHMGTLTGTHQADGSHTMTCIQHGQTQTCTVSSASITPKNETHHTVSCNLCSATEVVTKDVAHTFGDWTSVDGSTHTRTCSVCNYTAQTAHNYATPTNNGDGTHTSTCADCGHTEKASHVFGEWTPSEDGSMHMRTCECAYTEQAEHTFTYTLTDAASHAASCPVCQYSASEAHTEDGGVITQQPAVGVDGVKTFTCTLCGGVTRTETIPMLAFEITGGNDSTHTIGSGESVTITVGGPASQFTGVKIDSQTVAANHYAVTGDANSTAVTLPAELLSALANGRHDVTLKFASGSVSTTLTIDPGKEIDVPQTGDEAPLALWLTGMLAASAMLIICKRRRGESR